MKNALVGLVVGLAASCAWRDDGRQIAFNSVHEGSRQVYLMDVTPRTR